jgi:hypothetical protein
MTDGITQEYEDRPDYFVQDQKEKWDTKDHVARRVKQDLGTYGIMQNPQDRR